MSDALFEPVFVGALSLRNRIVMAPMTRGRAGPDDVPGDLMVNYYRQRATAGMIVTEGVQPSPVGKGYWRTPGIYSPAQIDGWRRVAEAVHAEGGRIVMQLMHCGRVVVAANRGYDADVVAPSALPCRVRVPGPDGIPMPTEAPRALVADEIPLVVEEFAQAARSARLAGIDGVELHCASGYLVNQFLDPRSNRRTDAWGGEPEQRVRFPLAVLEAMARAIGGNRVGFRMSPGNPYNGMDVADPAATFLPLLRGADGLGLAYAHVVVMDRHDPATLTMVRNAWSGTIIANNELSLTDARALVAQSRADLVSFGRGFIANPDLVRRLREQIPFARTDYSKIYAGEHEGYSDYPPAK